MLQVVRPVTWASLALGATITVLWGVSDPMAAHAEVKILEADGYYVMGDGPAESLSVAKERARIDARRAISERAGIFVESITEVQKGKLTRDEIRMISANILEVQEDKVSPEILADEVIRYHCHMVAKVDTSNIMDQLQQDRKKLDAAVKKNKELEAELDRANAELASLKQQYAQAQSDAAREAIQKQVAANEEWFTRLAAALNQIEEGMNKVRRGYAILDLHEKAEEFYQKGDYDGAIRALQKLLEIVPDWEYAPLGIGKCYEAKGDNEKALEWYKKAISLWKDEDESKSEPYYCIAFVCNQLGRYQEAVEAAQNAIKFEPASPSAYIILGKAYYGLARYEEAVRSLDQAEKLSKGKPDVDVYYFRGISYARWAKYPEAAKDLDKALSMDPSLDKAQQVRDAIRQALGI